MKPLLILISLIVWASQLQAQKQEQLTQTRELAWEQFKASEGNEWNIRWKETIGVPRIISNGLSKPYSGDPEIIARQFLSEYRELFTMKKELSDLVHSKTRTNRGVRHVTFDQYYNGIPVEGGEYLVHIRKNGQVDMVNGHYYPQVSLSTIPSITKQKAITTAMANLRLIPIGKINNQAELVVYPTSDSSFVLSYKTNINITQPFTNWTYFIDATNGKILDKYNQVTDVTGTGKVYPTHPLLPPSISTVNLYGLIGNGRLDGTYVRVYNEAGPEVYSASHSFQYSPITDQFDEPSLYYHVDNFRRNFIEALDGDNDLFTKIEAYAHSNFTCNDGAFGACHVGGAYEIHFGDGYSYAREDKVIHHEYSHAVIYKIEDGILSFNNEEGGISEGVPDYFAGSFTDRPKILEYAASSYQRSMVLPDIATFSEYEDERDNVLPIGKVDNHDGGEFFSSILWHIRNQAGITTAEADFLVFDALYRVGGNPDFTDFKFAMIAADAAAYGGTHHILIRNAFADKGIGTHLYPTPPAPTSLSITNIGTGSMVNPTLAWTSSPAFLDYFEVWRQKKEISSGIIDPVDILVGTSPTTSYTDISGLYQTLTDYEYRYYVKAVNTYGNTSYSSNYTSWIKLIAFFKRATGTHRPEIFTLNSNYPNPFNPSTNIKFELPETAEVSIKVYNIMGQQVATLVNDRMQAGFYDANFEAGNLASGVYIARLIAVASSGEKFIREIKMQLVK